MRNYKGQQVDGSNNNGLYQKKFVQDKWIILYPKMAHPDNSGSALIILLKFCRMKGANRYMKMLLFFKKKIYLGQFLLFSLEAIFLLFDWAWLKLNRVTVTIGSWNSHDMITFKINAGSLNSQDMIRIFKQSRYDFSGKH